MYVVTKEGYRLPVDDSSIDEDSYIPFQNTVGLYADDIGLKEIWIMQLQKQTDYFNYHHKKFEIEIVQELRYEHEPTEEEILWAMSAYGLTLHDVVTVVKGYEID